jgi:hypothetical protein
MLYRSKQRDAAIPVTISNGNRKISTNVLASGGVRREDFTQRPEDPHRWSTLAEAS